MAEPGQPAPDLGAEGAEGGHDGSGEVESSTAVGTENTEPPGVREGADDLLSADAALGRLEQVHMRRTRAFMQLSLWCARSVSAVMCARAFCVRSPLRACSYLPRCSPLIMVTSSVPLLDSLLVSFSRSRYWASPFARANKSRLPFRPAILRCTLYGHAHHR